MITREQFSLQMDRLIDTFGEKAFPDQREHMIWEALRGFDYASVISIVDGFIRSSKHAPMPQDFLEAAAQYSRRQKIYKLGEIQPREIAQCFDCADSGFIRLKRKETFEPWAKWVNGSAPCHCNRGKELIAAGKRMKPPTGPMDFGPQFNNNWLNSYSIVRAYGADT